jgi:hypothetical protein
MALIAPSFSSASDAGTSMKTFLQRLIPTTKDATQMMIELGLATKDGNSKFFDAKGNFIGMEKAAQTALRCNEGIERRAEVFGVEYDIWFRRDPRGSGDCECGRFWLQRDGTGDEGRRRRGAGGGDNAARVQVHTRPVQRRR